MFNATFLIDMLLRNGKHHASVFINPSSHQMVDNTFYVCVSNALEYQNERSNINVDLSTFYLLFLFICCL